MDKILSARLDEAVVDELERACKKLGTTKKQFLEEAIRQRAASLAVEAPDVWAETCGAWVRREAPETTIRQARRAFEQSMTRHRQARGSSRRRRE